VPVLTRRRQRARAWLALTVGLHVSILALTIALLPLGRFGQATALVAVIALAAGPLVGMIWLELRHSSARQPHQWPLRSLGWAFPQAIALGFAVNGVLDQSVLASLPLGLAITLVPTSTAALGFRSLLRPLVAELGATDFELCVEPRTAHRSWFYGDTVTLTDREIVIAVRSGSGRATRNPKIARIALADVAAVGARPALTQDSPWITLPDGRGVSVQPGDVIVIQGRNVAQVLPVPDAAVFAEIVRTRAARVRGAAVAALPVEFGALPAEQGHIPEVLPAPQPIGPVADPFTAPGTSLRSGPGMAMRWGLGFPLALLGIVGIPVGLLLYGGLLPPQTALERYRLVFCALWTTLAAAIWLRSLHQPRYWPVWALTSGLATAIVAAVQELGLPALLGPILGVLLCWAGRQLLIRPVSADLAGSRLEIPLRLRGGVTLLVQRDRLLLKVSGGAGGAVPQALPLGGLTLLQLGQFTSSEARCWPLPGASMRIWRGPVLRLVSGRQQWLIPVDAPRELAAIVRGRAAATPRRTPAPLTLTQWYELQSWTARTLTTTRRGPGLKQRTVGFRLVVAFPAALFGTLLFSEGMGRGQVGLDAGAAVAGTMLVIAMVAVGDWIRVRRRLRVAEDNALPPGSPAWGELRDDHAPLDGWQPWWEGPDQLSRRGSNEVGSR
jgi:hypothetical protein